MLEEQCRTGAIDIYYADECQVSPAAYVPYGWQFKGEQVSMPAAMGKGLNCFALINRENDMCYAIYIKLCCFF